MIELINHLNAIHPLSAEAVSALLKLIRAKELRRGQVWLQEGAVCDKLSFVVKGLMKLYFETGSKEVILQFAREDEWMISAQSYFSKKPSAHTIRCIEQTVIVYLLYTDLEHLLEKYPELNKHYLLIAQEQVKLMEAHTALLLLPPKQRLEDLMITGSWMFKSHRLTDRLLGGYLGIGANGLWRWRRGM